MKKFLSILFAGWFLLSLILLSPVQAQNNTQDRGPLTKKTVVHYRKDSARPAPEEPKGGKGACFGYLVSGAKLKVTEAYLINPTGSNLSDSFVQQAIDKGVAEWEKYGGAGIFGTSSLDFTVNTGFDEKNVIILKPFENNLIAVTNYWGYFDGEPATREIIEWDITLNSNKQFGDSTISGNSVIDLQNLITHELGHAAGMADLYSNSCYAETMFGYTGYGEISKRDLGNGDIQGIRKLYLR